MYGVLNETSTLKYYWNSIFHRKAWVSTVEGKIARCFLEAEETIQTLRNENQGSVA